MPVSPGARLIDAIHWLSPVEPRLHSTVEEDWKRQTLEWVSLESGIHYTQAISPFAGFVDTVDRLTFTKTSVMAVQFPVVVVVAYVACIAPRCPHGNVGVLAANVDRLRCLRHAAVTRLTHRGQMGTGRR